ncbi:hypothetical protein I6G80_24500 (plasmid) [Bacillus licheniformis]|uniref:Transcriptional regulator n=1 Tax=Bacillus licheniformis TaxID=1402 RepID=A0AB37GR65_BACLI|nr:hypothetical protein [Bacillus licheniformis]QPR75170.1 hypothetical protein I6G80_24500 [Bacillus licheniformis]
MDYVLSEKRRKVVEAIDRFRRYHECQLERYLKDLGVMTIYRARAQGEELGFVETKAFGRRKVFALQRRDRILLAVLVVLPALAILHYNMILL